MTSAVVTLAGLDGAGGVTRVADAVADAEFPVDTAGVAGRTTGVADVVAEFPGRQLPTGPVDAALFLATGQCCYKNMK